MPIFSPYTSHRVCSMLSDPATFEGVLRHHATHSPEQSRILLDLRFLHTWRAMSYLFQALYDLLTLLLIMVSSRNRALPGTKTTSREIRRQCNKRIVSVRPGNNTVPCLASMLANPPPPLVV
ncbi:hypothetical protein ASPBRDRAFT_420034 [Aspergillus brasiliensis CBS 101740]|uniref:Uncharacterized protein n=1 Tax=Aspergillus brasiliensis (strain CBS 101740 / IMI 381727 / IBT 21946) TaxID=767769 RepID=A0A1L9U4E2_ASPBC|nr:hypothetical protein ASPBRDRAFT_420034 [Aspergillus brasiliensis CBS 101740]